MLRRASLRARAARAAAESAPPEARDWVKAAAMEALAGGGDA